MDLPDGFYLTLQLTFDLLPLTFESCAVGSEPGPPTASTSAALVEFHSTMTFSVDLLLNSDCRGSHLGLLLNECCNGYNKVFKNGLMNAE